MQEVYENFASWAADHLHAGSNVLDIIRLIGWGLLKGLSWLADQLTGIYLTVLTLNSTLETIPEITRFKHFFEAISLPAFIFMTSLGLILILFGQSSQRRKALGEGILVCFLLVATLPALYNFANQILNAVNENTKTITATDEGSLTGKVLSESVFDCLETAQSGTETYLSSDPKYVDINTRIGGHWGEKDIFNYKIALVKDGKIFGTELKDPPLLKEINSEYLYRYDFEFFWPLVILLVFCIVLLFGTVKLVINSLELLFGITIGSLIVMTDIETKQRTKIFLNRLVGLYIVFAANFFGISLFIILSKWLLSSDFGWPFKVVFMLGLGFFTLSGSDFIVKVFGIDAGLQNGLAPTMAIYGMLSRATQSVKRAAGKLGSVIVGGAAGAGSETGGESGSSSNRSSKTKSAHQNSENAFSNYMPRSESSSNSGSKSKRNIKSANSESSAVTDPSMSAESSEEVANYSTSDEITTQPSPTVGRSSAYKEFLAREKKRKLDEEKSRPWSNTYLPQSSREKEEREVTKWD